MLSFPFATTAKRLSSLGWRSMGAFKEAMAAASDYRDIFGAENFYLEIMDHGIDIESRVKADLLKLGN